MHHQFRSKYIIQHKQLLLEHPPRFGSLMRYDVLAPHPEELPPFELLEEAELLDVVVGVSLDEPVAQSDELDRGLSQVKGDTLRGEGVVALVVAVVVLTDLEIVGVRGVTVRVQVYKD
jgi:hypothetical protein